MSSEADRFRGKVAVERSYITCTPALSAESSYILYILCGAAPSSLSSSSSVPNSLALFRSISDHHFVRSPVVPYFARLIVV